ncbi:Crp/Fnr family transcriptional regulator [Rhodobacteraceae bacterium B1Z28]|uniref:Crp/Fnr family transcriptional regulator n=1 Tax=Ruegeria haliotis TaxID=2747601 RepID=A0ABX2PKE7_9RHOB|nr:Crp/Fnr family transcriptional regulator [Ruegeria haliotis]NVO54181.1 Crp/Fnr family transcriptional regulator [Ruegeria haliotis]
MTLQNWTDAILDRLETVGTRVEIADGATLFAPGAYGEVFLILRAGIVRVEQTSPSGRTVVLYRVGPNDSCVMTTSCMLSNIPYSGFGYAEGRVTALAIGRDRFNDLLATDAEFRAAVFTAFSQRIVELSEVIDDLLLNRMDQKLAQWLVDQSWQGPDIHTTHQRIATELGSAREVMSRILKDFERRGWVGLKRGVIHVRNLPALRRHARLDAV